jgi:membrane protein
MAHATQEVPSQQGEDPHEPESPLELEPADWKATFKRTLREIKRDRVTLTAGGLAYYWFLAIFPLIIAAVALVTLLRLPDSTISTIQNGIQTALPAEAAEILTSAVTSAQDRSEGGLVVLIIGIGIALWSASSGIAGMQSGLNVAFDVDEDRKFLKKRLVSFVLLGAMLVLGGLAVALLIFGKPLGEWLQDLVPVNETMFLYAWTAVRWIVTLLVVTTLFAIFYYVGPNRDAPRWEWVSPGGIVATVVWLAASVAFSIYVSSFGSYGETYGALAGVVILILWLYLTGVAILVGGELNAELERQSEAVKKQRRRSRFAEI